MRNLRCKELKTCCGVSCHTHDQKVESFNPADGEGVPSMLRRLKI